MNNTISTNSVTAYITYLSKNLTEQITDFLTSNGFNVTTRWTGLLLAFISLGIIYLGIKLTKPIIKILLFVIGFLLLVGMIFPW